MNEELLCPIHKSLDDQDALEPFDNCIACIRVERDELRAIVEISRRHLMFVQGIIKGKMRARVSAMQQIEQRVRLALEHNGMQEEMAWQKRRRAREDKLAIAGSDLEKAYDGCTKNDEQLAAWLLMDAALRMK